MKNKEKYILKKHYSTPGKEIKASGKAYTMAELESTFDMDAENMTALLAKDGWFQKVDDSFKVELFSKDNTNLYSFMKEGYGVKLSDKQKEAIEDILNA